MSRILIAGFFAGELQNITQINDIYTNIIDIFGRNANAKLYTELSVESQFVHPYNLKKGRKQRKEYETIPILKYNIKETYPDGLITDLNTLIPDRVNEILLDIQKEYPDKHLYSFVSYYLMLNKGTENAGVDYSSDDLTPKIKKQFEKLLQKSNRISKKFEDNISKLQSHTPVFEKYRKSVQEVIIAYDRFKDFHDTLIDIQYLSTNKKGILNQKFPTHYKDYEKTKKKRNIKSFIQICEIANQSKKKTNSTLFRGNKYK